MQMTQKLKKILTLGLAFTLCTFVALSQSGTGNSNAGGNGNGNGAGGNGNGNGNGLDNNPNIDQFDVPDDDPDNPVIDAIPVDGGIMLLLAAGVAFGGKRLYKGPKKDKAEK